MLHPLVSMLISSPVRFWTLVLPAAGWCPRGEDPAVCASNPSSSGGGEDAVRDHHIHAPRGHRRGPAATMPVGGDALCCDDFPCGIPSGADSLATGVSWGLTFGGGGGGGVETCHSVRISEIKEEPSLEEMRELHRALEENRQERDHRAYVDSLPTPSSPVHRRKFMPLAQGSSPLETTTTTTTPQPPQATLDFYGMFLGNGVVAEPETGCGYASQVLPAQAPGPPPPARPPTPPHVPSKSSSSSSPPPPPPPLITGQQVPPGDSGSRNVRNSTHASAGGDRKSLSSRQSRVLKLRSVVQENRAKKEQKQRVALDPQIQD